MSNQKYPKKTKVKDQIASLVNFTKQLKTSYYLSFSNDSKKRRGKNTSKLILQGQHYPDTKPDKDTTEKEHIL